MKMRKRLATGCLALMFCLGLPIAAAAAGTSSASASKGGYGLGRISGLTNSAQVMELREQIKTLNTQIVADKTAIAQLTGPIAKDLAGAKSDASITASADYQTVQANLSKIKSLISNANAIRYKDSLTGVRGNNAGGAQSTLNSVITQMNQKLGLLDQAKTLAADTKTLADTIAAQKQTDLAAAQAFRNQAEQLKQQIDAQHTQIAALNDANKALVNQIVATFTANKNILAQNPTGLTQIERALGNIKTELSAEYDGKVTAACKQYDTDRKAKNYTQAINGLDTVVSLQQNRLTVLQHVQTELSSVLSDLNQLVSAQGPTSSSGSSSASGSATQTA